MTSGKRIALLENKLTLRGTTVALYDYAHYNETILHNTSIIITRSYEMMKDARDVDKQAYDKFTDRFTVLYYKDPSDLDSLVEENGIDILYIIKSGKSSDSLITTKCKTLIHCVFETDDPHGSYYCGISEFCNEKNSTNIPILHHMVNVHPTQSNLRESLQIPQDAIVFGCYGGSDACVLYTLNAIVDIARNPAYSNIYFLFMGMPAFAENSERLRFLPGTRDMEKKRAFINTCDAMVYTRVWGETFGLACGEFAVCDKPIIADMSAKDRFHIQTLGDNIIGHNSYEECFDIFTNFGKYTKDVSNNGYKKFTPEFVMDEFNAIIQKTIASNP